MIWVPRLSRCCTSWEGLGRETIYVFYPPKRHRGTRGGGVSKVILLVEDNPDDEALTLRALKKNDIQNQVVVARDGAQALEYLFGTGERKEGDPEVLPELVLLDLTQAAQGGRVGGVEEDKGRREDAAVAGGDPHLLQGAAGLGGGVWVWG